MLYVIGMFNQYAKTHWRTEAHHAARMYSRQGGCSTYYRDSGIGLVDRILEAIDNAYGPFGSEEKLTCQEYRSLVHLRISSAVFGLFASCLIG